MTNFSTYSNRNNGAAPVKERIRGNVADFYSRFSQLPGTVVVHTSELAEAQAAAEVLELAVEVRANGGCLVPEVWLVPKEKAGGLARDAIVTE